MDSLIMEIRAGAGGEEAAIFVNDLFRMYSKYAAKKGFKLSVLDSLPSASNGFKYIIFEISGNEAYEKLKYEGGVHRVQRVPKTEKSNRIHTSTVSVAVLLKPKETQIKINPNEIKMDFYKSSGPGGQYVNKRQTAVRVTHLPTGLIVNCQTMRNLEENKKAAFSLLRAQLYQRERQKVESQMSSERLSQIKTADRAEKIRTYNFPQDRITDHRINKNWHNIEKILDGNLDVLINKLKSLSAN